MVNYYAAIKRPFRDGKKLLIGWILYIVPFLNIITGLFAAGYVLRCLKSASEKDLTLPEWDNWGDLFIKGLLFALIGLVYFIPAFLVLLIFAGSEVGALLAAGPDNIGALFAALGGVLIAFMVVALIVGYVVPSALINFAQTGRFGSAFAFGKIFQRILTKTYAVAWITTIAISFVSALVIGLVNIPLQFTIIGPFVITAFVQFTIGVITMTIYGMVAAEE